MTCESLRHQTCWFSSDFDSWCVYTQGEQLVGYRCSDFDIFFHVVLRHGSGFPTLWSGGDGLLACTVWADTPTDVASAIPKSRFKRRVSIAVFKV